MEEKSHHITDMQPLDIENNENDRPRNVETLLIMTDDQSDNETDSDMLTSTIKVSLQMNTFPLNSSHPSHHIMSAAC